MEETFVKNKNKEVSLAESEVDIAKLLRIAECFKQKNVAQCLPKITTGPHKYCGLVHLFNSCLRWLGLEVSKTCRSRTYH